MLKESTDTPTLIQSTLIDCLMPAILAGIANVPALADSLVLKGGAALKQIYFPLARYSNDLDFSASEELPAASELNCALTEAARGAGFLLAVNRRVKLYLKEIERSFKPVAMRSFEFVYEWNGDVNVRIPVEISLDETIVKTPERLPLLNRPTRQLTSQYEPSCLVYTLDEIVAEKLRALLQWTRQHNQTGRNDMPVARTYYDLHYLLGKFAGRVVGPDFVELLVKKCSVRSVSFQGVGSFFEKGLVGVAEHRWNEQLSSVMPEPPQSDRLLEELARLVGRIL